MDASPGAGVIPGLPGNMRRGGWLEPGVADHEMRVVKGSLLGHPMSHRGHIQWLA